jgi:TctA family transporter
VSDLSRALWFVWIMVMATHQIAEKHAWLNARALRTASDIVLGGTVLISGTLAVYNGRGSAFVARQGLDSWFFPTIIGVLLLAVGIGLLVRASFFTRAQVARCGLGAIALIAAAVGAIVVVVWWFGDFLLRFGPPEYSTLIALFLAAAILLACRSRISAAGMALLGLLLATVGLDPMTGELRLTMGLARLMDGFAQLPVLLGLVVVADSLVCLVSPPLFAATYTRLVEGWAGPRIPTAVSLIMRVVAGVALAAACYLAFDWIANAWDVGVLLVFGAFGVACKIFAWNRLVLLLAFTYSLVLDQAIRQAMVMSAGDATISLRTSYSRTFLILAACVLAAAVVLSLWRTLSRDVQGAVERQA